MIQTCAFLCQRHRKHTPSRAIIATIDDDYRWARILLVCVFESLTLEGLTPATRETVLAVPEGDQEVSEAFLANKLNLSKGAISYRVRRALDQGWLRNLETRKFCATRLVRGEPMPDETSALPTLEQVKHVFEPELSSNLHPNPETLGAVKGNHPGFEGSKDSAVRLQKMEREKA